MIAGEVVTAPIEAWEPAAEVEWRRSGSRPRPSASDRAPPVRRRRNARPTRIADDDDEAVFAAEPSPEHPPPETVGGEGDGAEETRERRIPSRFLRNYKIQEVIKRRQILLVQVVKEERGTKGAALTTYLSLAGRFSVLMPNSPRGGGISRKITSASDRRRLKEIMAELEIPKGMGLIVRTAGANRPKPEIRRDCEYLLRLWDDIREHTLKSVAPALIYEEASLIKRSIRDVYSRDIDEIQVDGEEGWRAAHEFMRMLMPSPRQEGAAVEERRHAAVREAPGGGAARCDAAADRAASLRRLSGDQPDRGAGGDRRQLGPLDARARHRGDRAAHQHSKPPTRWRGSCGCATWPA